MDTVRTKIIIAITGAVLLLFVCGHLLGNLLIYFGAEALNTYAKGLHAMPFVLFPVRVVLGICLVVHLYLTWRLYRRNRKARGSAYHYNQYREASISSRHMIFTGVVLLFFIAYHLAHLTLKVTDARFAQFESYDVYSMLVLSFSDVGVAGFYMLAMVFLGLHLQHGISSLFQTLGISNKPNLRKILIGGSVLAWLIALGNLSIPLAIFVGIIG
ncbi:MAG: succinate dehydrogenase cytochrome b subunit [Pseudomonadota bacterium]|nr:succinate dehydrogenase cytochrome b subunit [Pseudomonadota bacterium]